MIFIPLIVAMWAGMHAGWECAPGSALVTLYAQCNQAHGVFEGADTTRGLGVIAPLFRTDADPLRSQRMADQKRIDALLRGGL